MKPYGNSRYDVAWIATRNSMQECSKTNEVSKVAKWIFNNVLKQQERWGGAKPPWNSLQRQINWLQISIVLSYIIFLWLARKFQLSENSYAVIWCQLNWDICKACTRVIFKWKLTWQINHFYNRAWQASTNKA